MFLANFTDVDKARSIANRRWLRPAPVVKANGRSALALAPKLTDLTGIFHWPGRLVALQPKGLPGGAGSVVNGLSAASGAWLK